MATIQQLSPELLVEIFSHYIRSAGRLAFMRNIPPVCKYWNELSSDSSLWRNVKVYNWNYLQHLSQRKLLYHTGNLEVEYHGESLSKTNLLAVLRGILDLKVLRLANITVSDNTITLITETCPHLEGLCLAIRNPSDTMLYKWDKFLTVCGSTLKHLDLKFWCSDEEGQQLVSRIAAKCPLLETLTIYLDDGSFPMQELQRGCPRLRELNIDHCSLINAGSNDSILDCGSKDLRKFSAIQCDFGGLCVYSILKKSIDFEHLILRYNENMVFGNISEIPSEKMRNLDIWIKDPYLDLETLEDAVCKWRCTLTAIDLRSWSCDIIGILRKLLVDNPNPQLDSLVIKYNDLLNLKEFIQKCRNLIDQEINWEAYKGREKIREALKRLANR